MAVKRIEEPGIGLIVLCKRKQSRNIHLRVQTDGSVRVSLPYFVPYSSGLAFVRQKASWIAQEQAKNHHLLKDGVRIGKAHHLYFEASPTAKTPKAFHRDAQIRVVHPLNVDFSAPAVQKVAQAAAITALRTQARSLLPERLQALAQQTGLHYHTVRFRQLKSRWGSCSSSQEITLSIFLMQLPWELIDYVLLHELTHTKFPHHGASFWAALKVNLPNVAVLRRQLRDYPASVRSVA